MIDVELLQRRQREWETSARKGGDVARAAALGEMREIASAVRHIHVNLLALGYPAVGGLIPVPANVDQNIVAVRAAAGGVPEILECFWQEVGGVALVDVARYAHLEFWRKHGLPWNPGTCDGVWVQPCDDESRTYLINEVEARLAYAAEEPMALDLSPDHWHKDNISGGAPYAVRAAAGWFAPMESFEWCGPARPRSAPPGTPDLVGYLRTALFECAGFPGYFGHPRFEPLRQMLLSGVELS